MTRMNLLDFFNKSKLSDFSTKIKSNKRITIIYGIGALLIEPNYDLLIYADMPRWEG